jgi:hypothetical protein
VPVRFIVLLAHPGLTPHYCILLCISSCTHCFIDRASVVIALFLIKVLCNSEKIEIKVKRSQDEGELLKELLADID